MELLKRYRRASCQTGLAGTDPQIVLDLFGLAEGATGVLGGEIIVGGSVDRRANGETLFDFDGQATLAGDVSAFGGNAGGSLTADFQWDLLSSPLPDGSFALSGAPRVNGLVFDSLALEIAGLARLTVDEATIDFAAPPGGAVASANDSRLEFLVEGIEGVGGNIGQVTLFDDIGADGVIDGFSIQNVTIGNLGTLNIGPALAEGEASVLQLTGSSVTIPDLTFRNGQLALDLPEFEFSAENIALTLPGANASASELSLKLNPQTAEFEASARSISVGIGDALEEGNSLFNIELEGPSLVIDDDPMTDILSVGGGSLTFGDDAAPLDALAFEMSGTDANQDQAFRFNMVPDGAGMSPRFGLGEFSLSTTGDDGVLASLGLGGLLPLDISDAILAFPQTRDDGYTDMAVFDVSVLGAFDFSVFGELPFDPRVSIGTTAHRDTAIDGDDGGTSESEEAENEFIVDIALRLYGQRSFSGHSRFPGCCAGTRRAGARRLHVRR